METATKLEQLVGQLFPSVFLAATEKLYSDSGS